jgi:PAS domain-containing protein
LCYLGVMSAHHPDKPGRPAPEQDGRSAAPVPDPAAAALRGSLSPEPPAVGRERRAVDAIEQQVVDAQRAVERGYWERRRAQARLAQLAALALDAVLLLDAESLQILDLNPAASALFGQAVVDLGGGPLRSLFSASQQPAFDELLRVTCTTGCATEMVLRLADRDQPILCSAAPAQTEGRRSVLLRARSAHAQADVAGVVAEAVVVSDVSGRLLWSNAAFAALCSTASPLEGRTLADLLGDPQGQWSALLDLVRVRSLVGLGSIAIGRPDEAAGRLSVSAVLLTDADQEQIGYTLRPLSSVDDRVA